MLLFTALSSIPVAAQTVNDFKYVKGEVVILDQVSQIPMDTISVDKFILINEKLPLEQQVENNKKLFDAMRKKKED